MAGYKGHLAGGAVATGTGILMMEGVPSLLSWLPGSHHVSLPPTTWEAGAYVGSLGAIGLLFALWPDVDTDSKGQRLFGLLFLCGHVALLIGERFKIAALMGLLVVLPMIGRHRGWTHTWWAMLAVPAPIGAIPYLYMPESPYLGFPLYGVAVLGYASHLLLDNLSGS